MAGWACSRRINLHLIVWTNWISCVTTDCSFGEPGVAMGAFIVVVGTNHSETKTGRLEMKGIWSELKPYLLLNAAECTFFIVGDRSSNKDGCYLRRSSGNLPTVARPEVYHTGQLDLTAVREKEPVAG
jgi:hypothetical protein